MRSRIAANNFRVIATSASWNVTYFACLVTFAPIFTSFSRRVVSDQCFTSWGSASPTSPLNSECAVFSGVAGAKSSLHFGLVYFRQPEFEVIEENLLVVGWLGDAPSADVDAATGWENHVHHS